MTHVFGLAHLLGRPGAGDLVRHGVDALTDGPLHDGRARRLAGGHRRRHEGRLPARLRAAGRVDGGHRRRRRGRRAARRGARASGRTGSGTTTPGWPSRSGTAPGRRLSDYRGVNANMHGVEAMLAAADALPVADQAGEAPAARRRPCAPRSGRCTAGPASRLAAARALHRRLDAAARVQPGPPGRPVPAVRRDGRAPVRVGAAGAARARGHARNRRPGCRDGARTSSRSPSGAARRAHGFPYTLDWDGPRRSSAARMHWVLCEAIAAGYVLAEASGDDGYRLAADDWRDSGNGCSLDPATGSWHHELTPDGRGRHRHLGRAARRLPPGADAAARGPAGARQRRRGAAVAAQRVRVVSPRSSRPDPPEIWTVSTWPTPGA